MNISKPFIDRPVMTLLVMISLLSLGILSYFKLPVADLPSVDYPTMQVQTNLPGASPETMANTIATPLEKQFMSIQGIDSVSSTNTLGQSQITLQFDINKNIDVAAVDVQTAISRASNDLPSNLPSPPSFKKINPADTPIMYLAITSDTLSLGDLYEFGNTFIGQRLSILQGVAEVQVYGAPYALRVNVDPDKVAAKGVTMDDISSAIQRAVPNLPSGQLDGTFKTQIIQSQGQLLNAEQMNPLIVRYQNGAAVRIEDIGEARDALENIRYRLQYFSKKNDREGYVNKPSSGVLLGIKKQPGSNTLQVAKQIKERLPILVDQIPQAVNLDILFDRSISIEESVFDVQMTLVLALTLVILVIFLYLGKAKDTLIPSIAMPLSIFITFIGMTYFHFTIDNLSLLALVLATGFIVDDAIVMLENIVRNVEAGQDRLTATYNASGQISFTIISMTLSLVAVFVPLVFMEGLIGKIFYEFSVVMILVILASGFISLTLTPMLASIFLDEREEKKVNFLAAKFIAFNDWLETVYKKSLYESLKRQRLVLGLGFLSLLLSLFFFWYLPKDFIPNDDIGFIRGYIEGIQGSSPKQMYTLQKQVNQVIEENNNILSYASFTETTGFDFIVLKPFHERQPVNVVMKELYAAFTKIAGASVFLKNLPLINLSFGTQSQGLYQYTLTSLNKESLFKSAQIFIDRLKEMPGFVGISSDLKIQTPQLTIEILRDEASSLGVEAIDIENTLLLAYGGGQVARIDAALNQYQIILELSPDFREKSVDLDSLWVRSKASNQLVPLSSVARWKEELGAQSINHLSQFPAVTISFSTLPDFPLSKAISSLNELSQEVLPTDVIGRTQGGASSFEKSIKSTAFLFLAAIFAIYIVLGILYESFIHPLTILSSLPPAILGGLLTLWIFGYPLSLYSYLGLILLIGIVKKNGILVVDFAIENMNEKNSSPEESIFEACIVRFRPIMMTTLCAIVGALPIALGLGASAEARRPLGLVIIGGLILSQLITLYLTPVVYLYMEKWNRKFSFKKQDPELKTFKS